jgi:protein tyrosine phosphatase (PTP) superfamily phosphohydrolase (DUF442 family)
MPPSLEDIQGFLQIAPGLSTAGQPTAEQFPLLQAEGVDLVINLAAPGSPDFLPNEAALVHSLGMGYLAIPVDWNHPSQANLDSFFAAMDANRGRRIFVHCARNMRVSCFVYVYRVLILSEDVVRCRADLEKIWQPNETWTAFMQDALTRDKR